MFATPYGRFGELAPGFRIYAALGNHDWKTSRAGALAELHYLEHSPPFYMDGFFYRVTPAGLRGQVELFVLDTELLLAQVRVPETAVDWDGSEILLPERDVAHEPCVVPIGQPVRLGESLFNAVAVGSPGPVQPPAILPCPTSGENHSRS